MNLTGKKQLYIGIAAVVVIVLILLFGVNHWQVTVTLNGDDVADVEYGVNYEDPGATARFHGTRFFTEGWDVPVTVENSVDMSKLGTYPVAYKAEKFGISATKVRMVHVADHKKPVIKLVADPEHYTLPGQPYEEEGYSAEDNFDGDITQLVTSEEREGKVYYTVSDSSGNIAEMVRDIHYDDPIPPELTLYGDTHITQKAGKAFEDPGFLAEDNLDGDLTDKVEIVGHVDVYTAGTYELTYKVKDEFGNEVSASRTVVIEPVRQPDAVDPGSKVIYLTFDDGPGPYTQELLDILAKYNVKATFFVVNTGYTNLISAEYNAGHSIGVHSATHEYSKIYASDEAYFADLNKMNDIIEEKTGHRTTLIRFPGGSSNAVSKSYNTGIMTRLTQSVTDSGYQYFDWNVLSGDAGDTTDTEQIINNVISGVQNYDRSTVLQHDIHKFSVDAVERIIIWGLGNGYTFLPLKDTSPAVHHRLNN